MLVNNMLYCLHGLVNPLYLERKNKYMWSMLYTWTDDGPIVNGMIKYDFEKEQVINTITFGGKDVFIATNAKKTNGI